MIGWRLYHRHYRKEVARILLPDGSGPEDAVVTFMMTRLGAEPVLLESDLIALKEVYAVIQGGEGLFGPEEIQ